MASSREMRPGFISTSELRSGENLQRPSSGVKETIPGDFKFSSHTCMEDLSENVQIQYA